MKTAILDLLASSTAPLTVKQLCEQTGASETTVRKTLREHTQVQGDGNKPEGFKLVPIKPVVPRAKRTKNVEIDATASRIYSELLNVNAGAKIHLNTFVKQHLGQPIDKTNYNYFRNVEHKIFSKMTNKTTGAFKALKKGTGEYVRRNDA